MLRRYAAVVDSIPQGEGGCQEETDDGRQMIDDGRPFGPGTMDDRRRAGTRGSRRHQAVAWLLAGATLKLLAYGAGMLYNSLILSAACEFDKVRV